MSHDVILTARLKSDQSVLSTGARGIDAVIPMRALETQGEKGSQGLHEAVQGCMGAVCRRRGQPG